MAKDIATLLAAMRTNPQNVRFADACTVADHYFGSPRQGGSSHRVWKMPWPGNPRVNMQNDGGKAKRYQVEQLLSAIEQLEAQQAKRTETEGRVSVETKARPRKGKRS